MNPSDGKGTRVIALVGGTQLFGQERANIEVLCALRDQGIQVKVVISRRFGREQIRPHLEALGIEWIEAPFGYYWGKYLLSWKFFYFFVNVYGLFATSFIIWREARRWKATHLYGANWLHLHYAIFALIALRLPLVFRAGDEYPKRKLIRRLVADPVLRRVSTLVCNCQFLRKRFEKLRRRPQRIDVIYNHPPQRAAAGKIGNLPASPRVSNDTVLLLYVGQITEAKGVSLLIEAAMQLIKRGADLALWVVGDDRWGNLRTRLEQQVEECGFYDSIRFLGYRDDVGELFQDAALHVCPSIWEDPSPNVIFEAKLAGVPSVVFPVGGVPELIEHNVDGFVCQESTVESLCEGIMHFVDEAVALEDAGYAARRSLDERFGRVRYCEEWREVFSRCRQLRKCRGNEA